MVVQVISSVVTIGNIQGRKKSLKQLGAQPEVELFVKITGECYNQDETHHISKFHVLSALNFGILDSSAKLTDAENLKLPFSFEFVNHSKPRFLLDV